MLIPETVARFNAHVTNRVTDPDCRLVPGPVRVALGLLDVSDFLSMRPAPAHF
jgi:hypothetical protein